MIDCIFCKIGAGQMKATLMHETPQVMAFRDINPQAPVHILIIPKKHIERLSSMLDGDMSLLAEIHKVAVLLAKRENLDETGFRLVTNNGKMAGQTVDHLHYHLLGGRPMDWPPG